MGLVLAFHPDPRAFHDVVIEALLRHEAESSTIVGLVVRMHLEGYRPVSPEELDRPVLLTIHDGPNVELVAVQTLRTTMLVSRASDAAVEVLADTLASQKWDGDFLLGVVPSVEALTVRYAAQSRRARSLAYRLRAFQLEHLTWPTRAPGKMVQCQPEHREYVARFISEFLTEIGEPLTEDPLIRADRAIAGQRMFVWIDGEPVALTGRQGTTPNGIRITAVYTPPEHRRKGYASNLVAHVTRKSLDEGRRFCFLYTDVANPTSNHIYQAIGYRPVADSERWRFAPPT